MLKPVSYQKPHVATRHIPYECASEVGKAPDSGGVIGRGETIWTENIEPGPRTIKTVNAFVERVGIVSLDPHLLLEPKRWITAGRGHHHR